MSDIRCSDDMDFFGEETDDALEDLSQDLYHRLIEDYGSNLDDPDRGLGLKDLLSGTLDPNLTQRIEAELRKDGRVSEVLATITTQADGSFRVEVQVVADEQALGITLESDGLGGIRRVQ